MMWDQHALEAWLEESARRDEDALVIQKYKKQDDSKIKVRILQGGQILNTNFLKNSQIGKKRDFYWAHFGSKLFSSEHMILQELQLLIEKLTDDRNKARRGLESETTETLTSQIELEKLAEEFKRAHSDRQGTIIIG